MGGGAPRLPEGVSVSEQWGETRSYEDEGWIPARPTTYNGIEMRSRTEAGFAQWLDNVGANWWYEPQAFGSSGGQWLPDFVVDKVVPAFHYDEYYWRAYVEVKGTLDMVDEHICRRMQSAADERRLLLIAAPDGLLWVRPDETTVPVVWDRWRNDVGALAVVHRNFMANCRPVDPPWFGDWWKGTPAA